MGEPVVAHYDYTSSCFIKSLDVFYSQGNEEDGHLSLGSEDEGLDIPAGAEAETLRGRGDDQNINCLDEAEGMEIELAEAASSSKSKHIFNQWSNAQILKLTEDLLCKLVEHRSRLDTGGVDQEHMVRLGQLFMDRAFSITTSRAPFLVDTNGNCLPNSLAFIANPNQTQEDTAEGGTGLRKVVMGEVLDYIRKASMEALEPIQAAAAASTANLGDWLSRDELLTLLGQY